MKLKQEKKDNRSGWNSYKEKGLNTEDKWFLISKFQMKGTLIVTRDVRDTIYLKQK